MMSPLRPLLLLSLFACYGDGSDPKDPGDDTDPTVIGDDTDTVDGIDTDDTPDPPDVTLPTPTVRFVNDAPTSVEDLVAEVVDPDPEATYTWAWTLDGAAQADLIDATVFGSRTLRGQTWEARATARKGDEVSPPGSATVVVRNAPPHATVIITPELPTTEAPLVAVPTPGDPDGDIVTFTWQWRVDNLLTGTTADTVPAGVPRKGQLWEVTAIPNDGQDEGEPATATIAIGNAPPRVNNVLITPLTAVTDTNLTASAGTVDPDNDRLTTSWAWYINGVVVPGATTERLNGDRFGKGDVVHAQATASDGLLSSEPVRSDGLVIGNTPPQLQAVELGPAGIDASGTLTCTPRGFTDVDGDPAGATFRWFDGGVEIAGATAATLGAPAFRRDDVITCGAAPFDGTDAGPELVSNAVTIRNTAPVVGSVRLSTLSPPAGQPIVAEAVDVVDADGDRVTLSWQWYVNGNTSGILPTLPSTAFGAGDRIWVVVTPTDNTTPGAPVRSPDAYGANTAPTAANVRISPSTPYTDDTLIASASGADVDGHGVSFRWAWTVDGAPVAGQDQAQLGESFFTKGQEVRVTATPWDGFAEGPPVTSAPVTVRNSPPSLEGARVTPTEVYETSTVSCEGLGWSDPDGDSSGWTTSWTVNGRAAGSAPTLTGADFSRGASIRCQLTPYDGEATGNQVTSDPVTVRNTPPLATGARLSNLRPAASETLSVTVDGAFDADGDTVEFRYLWRVNGAPVADTPTLPGPHPRGGTVQVEVTPADVSSTGAPVLSDTATVANTPPVVVTAALEPDVLNVGDTVRVVWTGYDADGDEISPGFQWFVNNTRVIGEVTEELPPHRFGLGDVVFAEVFVSDGYELSAIVRTEEVAVANQPPSVDGATIDPAQAWEDTVLRCLPGAASDPEGHPVSFQYGWIVNGLTVLETETLDGSVFNHDDRVICRLTPIDPYDLGEPVDSEVVVIQNTAPTLDGAALSALTLVKTSSVEVVPGTTFDLDNDQVFLEIDWYVSGLYVGSQPSLDGTSFSKDDTVWAEVTPTDGRASGAPRLTDVATVANTPPSVAAVYLEPAEPLASDTLTAEALTRDLDGDVVTVTWTWIVDEVQVQTGPDATLRPPAFGSGDRVRVIAVPFDGTDPGPQYPSGTITIDNTPPVGGQAEITPAEVYEYTVASCQGYGFYDPDGDPEGWEYRWKVNGALDASAQTLTGTRFRKGDVLTCLATPWDGTSRGPAVESPPVTVLNTPPTIAGATLSRTDPVEGNTIYVVLDEPRDADNDELSYAWTWYVNGVAVSSASQLDSSQFSRGDTIYAVVEVNDGLATASATSNTVTVANSLPVLVGLTLTPSVPTTVDDLTAQFTTEDADGDLVTVQLTWTVDDMVDETLTGPLVTADRTVKHEVYRVTAVPHDGLESGNTLVSDEVTVINTPPVMTGLSIGPQPFSRVTSITCSGTGLSDADGDTVIVDYAWWVEGEYFNSSPILEGYLVSRGDVVFCTGRPYDYEEYGGGLVSDSATVANSPPSVAGVTLGNTAPKEGDTITATAVGASDPDGDPVVIDWSWRVNGVVVANTSVIDSSSFNRGNTIQAFATPRDDLLTGAAVGSAIITALNAPPILTQGPTITPSNPTKLSTLSSTPVGTDPDGDTITWERSWYVQGALVQSSTTITTLAPSFFSKGQQVYVSIRGTDGTDFGPARTSTAVTIANTPPTLPTVSVTPARPRPGIDDLVCTRTNGSDIDGDTLQYEMRWRDLNVTYGGAIRGPNTLTLPGGVTAPGEIWYCDVRVNDGSGWSGWSTPAQVNLATQGQRSCADAWVRGGRSDGAYLLETDRGAELAWCDQSTLGGGWTRLLRTEGSELDWGQDTWAIAEPLVDALADEGVYSTFDTLRGFAEVLLVQTEGPQAGRWAAYTLWEDAGPRSMRELLAVCRDDTSVSDKARLVGHTSLTSGWYLAGDLQLADRRSGALAAPGLFSLCGVSEGGGWSYLTFTDATGQANDWTEGWWGPAQPGTIWSFASGPGPLGTAEIVSGAGWKGAGTAAEAWHLGSYEVYVR